VVCSVTWSVNRTEIELRVTANNIPESVDIDLSNANIGDVITSSDVTWPEGSKPLIDRAIAAISAPKTIAADDEEEGAEAADGEEADAAEGGEE